MRVRDQHRVKRLALPALAKRSTMELLCKVKFEVGGEEVVASGATVEDEDDAMAEAVIDEVLDGDEGLGHVAGAKGEGEGLSLEEVADDEDFFEVSNVIPNRRLSRKVASDYSRWGQISISS